MSDFGSNIFDDNDPAPPPSRRKKEEPPPAPPAPPPVEHRHRDVEAAPPRSFDDGPREPGRGAPGRERDERFDRRPRHDDRPRHEERPPHDERPHHREHPRQDDRPRHDEPRREPHGGYRGEPPRRHDERAPERDFAPRGDRPFRAERHGHDDRLERDRPPQAPRRDEPRSYEPPPPPPAPPTRAPAPEVQKPASPPATVALLIDLVALQAEAQAQGGELAFRRLRSGLAGDRTVSRAVCLAPDDATVPSGFDQATTEDSFPGGIRFTGKVLELLGKSGQIVLAPPSPAFQELAVVLRKAGHRVELAGFGVADDDASGSRRLGRDCLFVP